MNTAVALPLSKIARLAQTYASAPARLDATRLTHQEVADHVMSGYDDYLHGRMIPAQQWEKEFAARHPGFTWDD